MADVLVVGSKVKEAIKPIERPSLEKKPKKRKKKEELDSKVQEYLQANHLSLIEEIKEKDIFGVVESITQLGKIKFLVIVKNKKKINDADLSLALHKGQKNKTPVLFLTPGTLTKKARKYAEENQGLLIIKNIKF